MQNISSVTTLLYNFPVLLPTPLEQFVVEFIPYEQYRGQIGHVAIFGKGWTSGQQECGDILHLVLGKLVETVLQQAVGPPQEFATSHESSIQDQDSL